MAGRPIGWNPVVGTIYAPNGEVAGPPAMQRTGYDRTLMAHLQQSPWDAEFHVAEPVTLAASATGQEITTFNLPPQRLGFLRGVANLVAILTDYDNIRWRLAVNDTPILGFDNIIGPFGVAVYPKPVLIPLYPNARVRLIADNLTALPILLVTGYLMGTHFPMDLDQPIG